MGLIIVLKSYLTYFSSCCADFFVREEYIGWEIVSLKKDSFSFWSDTWQNIWRCWKPGAKVQKRADDPKKLWMMFPGHFQKPSLTYSLGCDRIVTFFKCTGTYLLVCLLWFYGHFDLKKHTPKLKWLTKAKLTTEFICNKNINTPTYSKMS